MDKMTDETFMDLMKKLDYITDILRAPNLEPDTIGMINDLMRKLIAWYSNPVITMGATQEITRIQNKYVDMKC